jgi:hypothetical protein
MKTGSDNTLGLIVGNRGFFPDHLAKSGRDEMIGVLEKAVIRGFRPPGQTEDAETGGGESRRARRLKSRAGVPQKTARPPFDIHAPSLIGLLRTCRIAQERR